MNSTLRLETVGESVEIEFDGTLAGLRALGGPLLTAALYALAAKVFQEESAQRVAQYVQASSGIAASVRQGATSVKVGTSPLKRVKG